MKAQLVVTLEDDNRLHLRGNVPSPALAKKMLQEAFSLVQEDGRDRETGLTFPTPDQVRVLGAQRGS